MSFDYKKEYKEYYLPPKKPTIVNVPKMNYLAIRGKGNPNAEDGEYKQAIGILYSLAYALKMSHKKEYKMEGYFEYVVPPLEGFWWQEGVQGVDYTKKDTFEWIAVIRLPDFVTKKDFDWAVEQVLKKGIDASHAMYFTYDEGLCVQCMHIGSYDEEPVTVEAMHNYAREQGYQIDITDTRMHHEIYISDVRKCAIEKLKTVVRHPIKIKEKV